MTMLSDLRDRLPHRAAATKPTTYEASSPDKGATGVPIKNYDRLDSRDIIDRLSKHTQVELTQIEDYERANKNRPDVLDKLRYMRCAEPFEGYDEMDPKDVVASLENADLATIKRVRAYEAKFAGRHDIVEAVAKLFSARRASTPRESAPAQAPSG